MELYMQKLGVLKHWIVGWIDGFLTHDDLQREYNILEINDINKPKDKERGDVIITDHAYDRAKERLGMNKSSFLRLAAKAFESGVKHADTTGNLCRYIDRIWLTHKQANNVRIHGEVLFMFKDKVLITVYQVPHNLRKSALKIQK